MSESFSKSNWLREGLAFWQKLANNERFSLAGVLAVLLILPFALIVARQPTQPSSRAQYTIVLPTPTLTPQPLPTPTPTPTPIPTATPTRPNLPKATPSPR